MAASVQPESEQSILQYSHSTSFPTLLEDLGLSLAVTTYQAGKLMLVRAEAGRLSTLLRTFEQAMGLAVDQELGRMVVGTRRMVWTLASAPEIAPQLDPPGRHDACFVPRVAHVTGDILGHEIVLVDGKIWIANTLLSCLCTLDDERYGFVPRWRPPFVDRLVAEDRCHLNGIATADGKIRFVTAFGMTNEARAWKADKAQSGDLIDVASGETVGRGLCMPHSPRCYRGHVFLLNSGQGQLSVVDVATGKIETVVTLPGYARGLAFHGKFAFVGLSLIRETDTFGNLPISDRLGASERKCGIYAIDLESGNIAGFLHFDAGCAELFDIQVLPGMRFPTVVGFQGQTLDGILIAPPSAW